MLATAIDTIAKLIHTPPGQLAVGSTLFYGVQKFFKEVEEKLTDDTNLEIAVWLLDVKVGQKMEPWPTTFLTVFDGLFGTRSFSWKSFRVSAVVTLAMYELICVYAVLSGEVVLLFGANIPAKAVAVLLLSVPIVAVSAGCLPDWLSVEKSRFVLRYMKRCDSSIIHLWLVVLDGVAGIVLTSVAAVVVDVWYVTALRHLRLAAYISQDESLSTAIISDVLQLRNRFYDVSDTIFYTYPAMFTSMWIWLYAGSGFLLKTARRFDIGFNWFNRRFDIEKKPLQSIGVIAGALVAIVYWSAVVVSHVVS